MLRPARLAAKPRRCTVRLRAVIPEVVQALLDAGADMEAVDGWFELTPLGWGTAVDWAPAFRRNRP